MYNVCKKGFFSVATRKKKKGSGKKSFACIAMTVDTSEQENRNSLLYVDCSGCKIPSKTKRKNKKWYCDADRRGPRKKMHPRARVPWKKSYTARHLHRRHHHPPAFESSVHYRFSSSPLSSRRPHVFRCCCCCCCCCRRHRRRSWPPIRRIPFGGDIDFFLWAGFPQNRNNTRRTAAGKFREFWGHLLGWRPKDVREVVGVVVVVVLMSEGWN